MPHKLEQYYLLECDELPFEGVRFSQIRDLPKIDLHRHLVGSIRPEVLTYIADKLNVTIPTFGNDPERIRKCSVLISPLNGGYRTFLQKRFWGVFQHIFSDPRGCQNAMYWAVADASRDNVKYVEFRVSPYGINPDFPISLPRFIRSLKKGITAASRDFPNTIAKIILSVGRKTVFRKWLPQVRSRYYDKLVNIALDFRDVIVGFDLSGNEEEYRNDLFVEFADKVKHHNLKLTVHAGETGDAESVWDAINLLHADRIGHGIGIQNDPRLLQRIINSDITLELCPTSNWLIGVVPSLAEHPFGIFFRQGIRTTVNTDDPVLFGDTTLSMEFYRLIQAKHISMDDIQRIQYYSLDAIFADNNVKSELADRLGIVLAEQSYLNIA